MARIVVVSNRVPTPAATGPRAGGLAVALADAIKIGDLWFGWSGETAAETSASARVVSDNGIDYATIDLSEEDYDNFYVGYANSTLWPLLHFRPGLIEFERASYESYLSVNRAFARALQALLRDDDLIWVHDYHLVPLASELRTLGVKNRIGFFLHVPFVPATLFETIPNAQELMQAFGAYDVIGFQTEKNAEDFRACLKAMLHVDAQPGQPVRINGHDMLAMACPIGIDAKAFAKRAKRSAQSKETKRLHESLGGRALIIGVDRLDYTKGLPNRFEGFARLLERFPEHRQKVSYLQVAARSREDVGEYQRLKRDLDRRAGDINGRFGDYDWVPLRYMTRPVARNTLAGFYQIARVGLVTPYRDGMNLVAKEFVAAQTPEDPGVLILSIFAGAAEELSEAIIINPLDADAIAEALHQALVMPLNERQMRYQALYEKVMRTSAKAFCDRFVGALRAETGALIPG